MIPDYLFGPKLERMFSDGLKLFAWSSLFTKQTYLDNKKPGPGHSSQILNYLKKKISDQNFQNFLIAMLDLKRKINPECQNSEPFFHL